MPNDNLPPAKRLSDFVLLLPYLGVRPSYITEGNPNPVWDRWQEELKEQSEAAKELYATIDLAKAWDDPVNLPAAKTLVPLLVTPSGAPFRDERRFPVSHFAFARGSDQSPPDRDDDAFPFFLDRAATDRDVLTKMATRSGREVVQFSEPYCYRKVANWKKSRE